MTIGRLIKIWFGIWLVAMVVLVAQYCHWYAGHVIQ